MLAKSTQEFINYFKEIEDPRQDGKILYPIDEVLLLIFIGVLSGAETWDLIIEYGETKLHILKKYLPYDNGIPAKSTLCTIMGILNKTTLESWFNRWFTAVTNNFPEDLIAIDGKTLRGSKRTNTKGIHMLHAFSTRYGIVIGQKTVEDKTNEITALPEFIDELDIKGCVISTDAMGCQKEIANTINAKEADYFLALKNNHKILYEDVTTYFNEKDYLKTADYFETIEKAHGRIEIRKCWSLPIYSYIKKEHKGWNNLASMILVERERIIGNDKSVEKQLYISSIKNITAKQALHYSRSHWSVENQLHWVLDVSFNEDRCTINKAAANMAVIRKLALNALKNYKKTTKSKLSLVGLRHLASWSDNNLEKIMKGLGAVV